MLKKFLPLFLLFVFTIVCKISIMRHISGVDNVLYQIWRKTAIYPSGAIMVMKRIPNMLTISRIVLIPILIGSFYLHGVWARYLGAGIFIFASITDYVDGKLARSFKIQSDFGTMLDPIADKMLVVSTLVMLVDQKIAPVLPTIAIICREIFISGMREHLAAKKVKVYVNFLSKIKTAIQMLAIIVLLLGHEVIRWRNMLYLGQVAIWISACLTIMSGYVYLREWYKYV